MKIPSQWNNAGDGVYHFNDMAIYSKKILGFYEVHLLSISKSKFSNLFASTKWDKIIEYVEKRSNVNEQLG